MNLNPNPQYTKQTRCNNNLILDNKSDFFRPILSNTSIPISNNHEHYNLDKNAIQMYQYDLGTDIANICKWDGKDIVDAIGFYVSMTVGRPMGEKIENLIV